MLNVIRPSFLAGATCTLATLLSAPYAKADTLSWNNVTYNPGPTAATTKTNIATVNGNTISIQFGNGSYFNNNNANTPSPAVGGYAATANTATGVSPTYADGGTGSKALQIFADFDNSAGNIIAGSGIPVTVFFSQPVSNLIFSFYDVDGNTGATPFNDQINNIFGLGTGGGAVLPISLTPGATNTASLTATSASFTGGNTSNPQNANGGNATVTFGGTPITQFTFTYTDPAAVNGGTAHSATQIIALGDLSFVPEPSTWACLVMAGSVGIWTLHRRARRRA